MMLATSPLSTSTTIQSPQWNCALYSRGLFLGIHIQYTHFCHTLTRSDSLSEVECLVADLDQQLLF